MYVTQPSGYEPSGYEPRGYEPRDYEPRGYEPRGYRPRGYEPRGHTSLDTATNSGLSDQGTDPGVCVLYSLGNITHYAVSFF